jgi:hypothetical protein
MENLKIKQKTEDMIKYGYIALRQFPKSEKFSLGMDIKKTMFGMLGSIIRANRNRDKRDDLFAIDIELEVLRTQVRLAMEMGFLPFAKYEIWAGHLAEIGRMLGGWVKHAKKG